MKTFLHYVQEQQDSAFRRHYGLSQKKRHDVDKAKLDRQAEYLQEVSSVGLQAEDVKTKLDQILFGLFYLGNALRLVGEVSSSNINATVSQELTPTEIDQKLEKNQQSPEERLFIGQPRKTK
jgi:hypothetical protein